MDMRTGIKLTVDGISKCVYVGMIRQDTNVPLKLLDPSDIRTPAEMASNGGDLILYRLDITIALIVLGVHDVVHVQS
ncbi:hypothetical protein A3E76_04105 [Candidatus Saccharibacteria bacterium RIFCSPHIGHO2_12_FULL_44_22]|nr:MAG: hypothetical protein A3E76_04105 [Candidatus Saccharibacteria bacterium RIFCSPHIGHO2_12_FULL_44_22]